MSYAFSENDGGGTDIEIRIANAKPKDKAFLEHVVGEFRKTITNEIAALRQMLERSENLEAEIEAGIEKPEPAVERS
jgi:hypothetical protein